MTKIPETSACFWRRPAMDRRVFFRHAGAAVAGSFFLPGRSRETVAKGAAMPMGTARNVTFVMMAGGPSHSDTFDLKEGAWTLPAMEPTSYGDIRWPRGLFPKLAESLDSIALVRSMRAHSLVHGIAQTWIQIGRNPLSGVSRIAPHIGSVVARELEDKNAILPAFLSLNSGDIASPPDPSSSDRRYGLLLSLEAETRAMAELEPAIKEREQFNPMAETMMCNPAVNQIFTFDAAERARYGTTAFGNACISARNLLRAKLGTRLIQITVGGWDMHTNVYAGANLNPGNANSLGRTFDLALGTLLADLKADGLLDETLVLCIGEFGRTVGPLNSGSGRDHCTTQSMLLAGAKVRGGQVVGQTDSAGNRVVEYGWAANREIRPEDIEATIYSALGIDWTKVYHDDPPGSGFALVPTNQGEEYQPIQSIWA